MWNSEKSYLSYPYLVPVIVLVAIMIFATHFMKTSTSSVDQAATNQTDRHIVELIERYKRLVTNPDIGINPDTGIVDLDYMSHRLQIYRGAPISDKLRIEFAETEAAIFYRMAEIKTNEARRLREEAP